MTFCLSNELPIIWTVKMCMNSYGNTTDCKKPPKNTRTREEASQEGSRDEQTRPKLRFFSLGEPERGYTRGDTHTQMRSTTHYVRSDTPGNNLSFVFSGMSCINSKLHHHDDPMSPVTTVSYHHHHICSSLLACARSPPALSSCLPRTLAMADKDQENGHGPLQVSSPCSAPYLLTTHHHHLLPHHQP